MKGHLLYDAIRQIAHTITIWNDAPLEIHVALVSKLVIHGIHGLSDHAN